MRESESRWFARRAHNWYEKDQMSFSQRGAEVAGLAALLLVTSFFILNQLDHTGFFTSAFGPLEIALFYLPVLFGGSINVLKIITGRRNLERPLEALSAISVAVAGFWFFVVFPFDFSHLADLVPNGLRFLLSWIPNWLGRDVVLLSGVIGLGNAIYDPALYIAVRREFTRHTSHPN